MKKIESPKSKINNVLFVCVGNACRSQMAEGFARHYGAGIVEADSAGTAAAGWVAPLTIEVMRERNIDIGQQTSKNLTGEMIKDADIVITLGCCSANNICPMTYSGERVDWDIRDPIGESIEVFRETRDEIERRVKELMERLRKA